MFPGQPLIDKREEVITFSLQDRLGIGTFALDSLSYSSLSRDCHISTGSVTASPYPVAYARSDGPTHVPAQQVSERKSSMSFFALILKNLLRQRVRTGLTVLGISIGITTVVALGAITGGMRSTFAGMIRTGDADFMVAQKGASDLTFSAVSVQEWAALAEHPDVLWAHGVLMDVSRVGSNPYFVTLGIRPADLAESPPTLVSGVAALQAPDDVLLGERAATALGLGVGDRITIGANDFRIVGIYRTGTALQDNGAYAVLDTLQTLTSRQGIVTAVFVKVRPGASPAHLATTIEATWPTLAVIADIGDVGKVDQGVQIMDALNLAISVLAVGIGAIGVMNTMVMSVYERTREIGILRAVGWSTQRILRMIVGESLIVCVIAAGVGVLLGLVAIRGVMLLETVKAFIEPSYAPEVFIRALVVAVVVALVGAAYPAFRAVRLTPMEALRHE
ncbi:MAG: ABC transporter permease [Chloroflexi bacterium]|nr:MAG: ABC transporter permease [Chloroflexota bacterium]